MLKERLLIVISLVQTGLSIGCLNHNGQQVDWWVVLKIPPKIGKSGFGYIDSKAVFSKFDYVPYHID